ncbi:hypothetical protein SH668x_000300 [Planctomicrobium sp. SH668]|uniref:hypothetical protein n=1 Tax=Planctomicrobium sp. SH668 TaxID=3448126 RepID=UPI003F5BF8E6
MYDYPVRAGVFSSLDQAIVLVRNLEQAGFSWQELSVICSDESKERLFPKEMQHPLHRESDSKLLSAIGTSALGLGGVAAATILSTGGAALFVLGAFAGLAALGTYSSLMASRGFESEAMDYYEQSLQNGDILIAVEVPGDTTEAKFRRDLAATLIEKCGAKAILLAH